MKDLIPRLSMDTGMGFLTWEPNGHDMTEQVNEIKIPIRSLRTPSQEGLRVFVVLLHHADTTCREL